jgi:hypothetical protein
MSKDLKKNECKEEKKKLKIQNNAHGASKGEKGKSAMKKCIK